MTNRTYILFGVLASIILGATLFPIRNQASHFHTKAELAYFRAFNHLPPLDSNLIFPTASHCSGCHGYDAQGNALLDSEGNDVNIHDDWQTSMMANSAKDPFWRAKVSHEVLYHPAHKDKIEDTCTKCHAPQGHYTAHFRGATHYTMDSLLIDTTGLDGVSCLVCHAQKDSLLGDLHSGELLFDTNRVAYGPYPFPFNQPMQSFVGIDAVYSEHINDAGLCAGCHTLITETFDLEGNPTGNHFVEQATYHEWLNSSFADPKSGTTCQGCHLPRIDDSVVISANYIFLEGRSPFGLHQTVGGNTFMLKLMKEHKEQLGIHASDEAFDETIAATFDLLQQQSLEINLVHDTIMLDTAYFSVAIRNKTGHKFPSGYPSRRAVVEFLVITQQGDTLFQSGGLDNNFEAKGIDPHYEPHHDVIRTQDQVQIYETVSGDVSGQFSTLLERGFRPLKDNRLPPQGFTKNHAVYDTTLIVGNADIDPDFNIQNGQEGTATDVVHYRVPFGEYTGNVQVTVRVWYQSLPPRWLAPMLAEDTPEINTFRTMYDNADQSPVLVVSDSLENIYLGQTVSTNTLVSSKNIEVYPNPSPTGQFTIQTTTDFEKGYIYDIQGKWVQAISDATFQIPHKGVFILQLQTKHGWVAKKLVVE